MKPKLPYPIPVSENVENRFWHIPMGVLEVVAVNRLIGPFQLYLYLKKVSCGQLSPGSKSFTQAAKDLKISTKTVKRRFVLLRERNWIGQLKSGTYVVRSWDKLRSLENCPSKAAVIFDKERDLSRTRAFVESACICYLVRKQSARLWREKRLPEGKRGTSRESNRPLPTFYFVANKALARIYGISIGTAFNWKRLGKSEGYLDLLPTLRPMFIDNGPEWKRVFPEQAHRLVLRDDMYFLQYPDKVKNNMTFCRRRCMKQVFKKKGWTKNETS